ncbi:hypothetical protein SK571_19550 [Lentzea sp. BCCO 10_0798]|uniref:Uncharacterized protein n=1 Tax=Lentzea kristufekii TaxID=3095430 RepID=A0ABU4TTG8_9PSEU|nr:hypothetical protein [Lentzea sp. BCCO 10_0798]MDX8051589.1 hypothetical protein [Lentzea sp. BCCO 10_0798]
MHVPPSWSDDLLVVSPATPLKSLRGTYSMGTRALAAAGASLGVRLLTDLAGETALAAFPGLAAGSARRPAPTSARTRTRDVRTC